MDIVVIGGGPAGTFFTHRIIDDFEGRDRDVRVTVIEKKLFPKKGPSGCNLCAGLISSSMIRNLGKLGIELPDDIIQNRIDSYVYHTEGGSREIEQYGDETIYAVYRGGGPLYDKRDIDTSFDQVLLDSARDKGANVINSSVQDVILSKSEGEKHRVIYDENSVMECDIVVGAFGLNSRMGEKFSRKGFGYSPPETMPVAQMEINAPEKQEEVFGSRVHVFCFKFREMIFAAMVPKRNYITFTMLARDLSRGIAGEFIEHPRVRKLFPEDWSLKKNYCQCFPKLGKTEAPHPYFRNLVMVGDAHVCRFYKNGIGSAFYTASVAAETISEYGSKKRHFRKHYIAKCRDRYYRDNMYGRILFKLNEWFAKSRRFSRLYFSLADKYEKRYKRENNRIHFILWAIFTGEKAYKKILKTVFHPKLIRDIFMELIKHAFRSFWNSERQ